MSETETTTKERPWTCNSCGLTHSHYDSIPRCHCGWHEAHQMIQSGEAHLVPPESNYIEFAAERLPIPEGVSEEIYGEEA
jgi:hypothetical protein